MAAKMQKTQKEWQLQWTRGKYTVRELYDKGFRSRSNKYNLAVYEYKYYGRHYSIDLVLSDGDYNELKDCPSQIEREYEEQAEREEWERFCYLKDKFKNHDLKYQTEDA